jgi:hypothetical protein
MPTDTIRIMKHTDLPAGCNSTYVVGIKSHCRARTFASRLAATSSITNVEDKCSHENGDSQVVVIHDNFQNGAIKQDHTDIAALAMIIVQPYLINTRSNYVHSWTSM